MTYRTSQPINCECGHRGSLDCAENDSPYGKGWEHYTLSGFKGGEIQLTGGERLAQPILVAIEPECPACGKVGAVSYGSAEAK
jgi:hypothetical protein